MQTTVSNKYQVVIPKPIRENLILISHASFDELRGIAAGAGTDDHREKKDRFI